ncbi:MAG: hypothetical protein J6039_04110 [Alphaproteobacteria bacterium]|nr:hypothetical protein [Alphaproteobacteria bacterium]
MKSLFVTLMAFILLCGSLNSAQAQQESENGNALPRMVSLRSSKINARSGPGSRYPIEWVYQQRGAPVEIIAEFELWRKVKDWEGSESWIHKAMLTNRRFAKVIIPGENNIYAKQDDNEKIIAKVEDGVVGEVEKCPSPKSKCLLKFENIRGWMPRESLFGVYSDEVIK